jgi:hypothetical protein
MSLLDESNNETQTSNNFLDPDGNPYKSNSIWNNPAAKQAWDGLSPEEQEHFQKIGAQTHAIDVVTTGSKLSEQEREKEIFLESASYIISAIKSGIHPSMLEENEIKVLKTVYGDDWYIEYGFEKEDMTEIRLI